MQYWAVCYTPISQTGVAPHVGLVLTHAALDEVCHFRLGLLPSLPYTHADTAAKPLVSFFKEAFHIGKVVVPYPTAYILGKLLLPPVIAPTVAPTGQLFQPRLHLCLRLGVYHELALAALYVEGVTKVLHTSDV